MLFVLAAVAAALAVFVTFNAWRNSAGLRKQTERPITPAAPAAPNASPAPRLGERELESASSPRVHRFAKCISPKGAASYSDGPCPPGTRSGEVAVQPDDNLADGMTDEARRASLRRNSAIAQSAVEYERRVATNVDASVMECAQLNALVASIDAMARQPQPGFEQDRLRDQRKRARDRQFALRCA